MFVAKSDDFQQVVLGSELQRDGQTQDSRITKNLSCVICGTAVKYNPAAEGDYFEYFSHTDGSPDCFESESTSDEHRLAVEVSVKSLYNRIQEVTGAPIEINVEKWVGEQPDFIITDIRIASPVKIAIEVFYKASQLGLRRRLSTIFENGYRAYLIFHTSGKHNVDRIQRHLQKTTSLHIGRFDAETLEVSLGDLVTTERVEFSKSDREQLPDYITRSLD
jgi:hypothetical protein